MSKVDLKRDCEKRLKNKFGRKLKRNAKLQELEKQLQFAESRCGTLKQQLNYIKLLYGCGNVQKHQFESSFEGRGGGDTATYINYKDEKWNVKNSNLEFKEDGDAPEILNQMASHSNSTCTNSSIKQFSTRKDEQKLKTNLKQKRNAKLLKIKKNTKKMKRKRKVCDVPSSKFSNVSSQTQSQIWQDPLVEIYKNSAVNAESESGLEIPLNKKRMKPTDIQLDIRKVTGFRENNDESQCKVAEDTKTKQSNSFNSKKVIIFKDEEMQTECTTEDIQPRNKETETKELCNKENQIKLDNFLMEPLKNYCQPTISSKRKQVERDVISGFNNINVRNIPFIAAKSTTPSHNIGVNIQQVLSIMKNRQHVTENSLICVDASNNEKSMKAIMSPQKINCNKCESNSAEMCTIKHGSSESKKRSDGIIKTSLSYWKGNWEGNKDKQICFKDKTVTDKQNQEWNFKVEKLKKVLVFLHEDFTSLSQKYKKLHKKLTKRNINKIDAKGELAEIEKDLTKKEEEITVVIGLYKEVLNLREDVKKLQEKNHLITSGKPIILDGLKQSNSAHSQMSSLLRKIQNFQDRLKG